MDQTAIKAGPVAVSVNGQAVPPVGTNGAAGPATKPTPKVKPLPLRVLEALADLRITVVLFALALVLVFWGTLAQVDKGVWTVVHTYFRWWVVLVPLKVVSFLGINDTKTVIPFPGGWLIGSVMMVNLLAAHAIRFKLTWSRSGIFLIHAGIIVMMVGEMITGLYEDEGRLMFQVGQTSSTVVDIRHGELAIVREADAKTDEVVAVPAGILHTGAMVDDNRVPFKIDVVQFMVNSRLNDVPGNHRATRGFGRVHVADEVPEVSGVDTEQAVDLPSVYLKLTSRDGKDLGTWLFSTRFTDPQWQWVEVGGKMYKLALRFKQSNLDFRMRLTKFDHKVFPGDPNKTKDYRSHVHLVDKTRGVDRDVQIYMNAPLYYNGLTFYQSGMDRDERGVITSTLQVVRNPGWLLPYLSCGIVGFGLLVHFGLTLFRFLNRRIVR